MCTNPPLSSVLQLPRAWFTIFVSTIVPPPRFPPSLDCLDIVRYRYWLVISFGKRRHFNHPPGSSIPHFSGSNLYISFILNRLRHIIPSFRREISSITGERTFLPRVLISSQNPCHTALQADKLCTSTALGTSYTKQGLIPTLYKEYFGVLFLLFRWVFPTILLCLLWVSNISI